MVESANKLVVEARLKGAGMHWRRSHVDPMLALRNLLGNDRWEQEWPHIKVHLIAQAQHLRVPPASSACKRPVFRNVMPSSPPNARSTPPSVQNGSLTHPPPVSAASPTFRQARPQPTLAPFTHRQGQVQTKSKNLKRTLNRPMKYV